MKYYICAYMLIYCLLDLIGSGSSGMITQEDVQQEKLPVAAAGWGAVAGAPSKKHYYCATMSCYCT